MQLPYKESVRIAEIALRLSNNDPVAALKSCERIINVEDCVEVMCAILDIISEQGMENNPDYLEVCPTHDEFCRDNYVPGIGVKFVPGKRTFFFTYSNGGEDPLGTARRVILKPIREAMGN